MENDDLLLIPGRKKRGKCQRGSFWKIPWSSTSHFCLCHLSIPNHHTLQRRKSVCIAPCTLGRWYASHPLLELSVWSSFDHLWVVFNEELLGDDVISWLCSFRQWSNTFRDLGALSIWTFMIWVEVPKNVYNSCPLKHEVVNLSDVGWNALLWGSEVFPRSEATCNKIQYNTLFWQKKFMI